MSRHTQEILLRDGDLTVERWQVEHIAAIAPWMTADAEWKTWDAPYLPGPTEQARAAWVNRTYEDPWQRDPVTDRPMRLPLCLDSTAIGTLSWHWEDPVSGWARVAIVLYDPQFWGRGIGTRALAMWVDWVASHGDVHRVDLATWSGNERMLRAARSIGMTDETRLREARLVDGAFHDSVVLGVVVPPPPAGTVES